jgi:hypothetical protein
MFSIILGSSAASSVLSVFIVILAHILLISFAIIGEIILIPLAFLSPLLFTAAGIFYYFSTIS